MDFDCETPSPPVCNVKDFVAIISEKAQCLLDDGEIPWFRGECCRDESLTPSLFRTENLGLNENYLVQSFRMQAPGLIARVPNYERTDEWLFLMQHHGVPTRLLDWTEGALFALYFSVNRIYADMLRECTTFSEPSVDASPTEQAPKVWMLNPCRLNQLSIGNGYLPLTWNNGGHCPSPSLPHIRMAFEDRTDILDDRRYRIPPNLPVAVRPPHVHSRVTLQKGRFTVHGIQKLGLRELLDMEDREASKRCLVEIPISRKAKHIFDLMNQLRMLGISQSTLMLDLDDLACDLRLWKGRLE